MAKEKVKDIVGNLLRDYFEEEGFELYNTEFVKEGPDWFLRVYVDRADGEYVSIEDCEKISRYLSDKLDEKDPIAQNYYLEVSSPGMDRELITEEHIQRFAGSLVDIKLYKALNGKKEMTCTLLGTEDGAVAFTDDKNGKFILPRETIAQIKLAIIF